MVSNVFFCFRFTICKKSVCEFDAIHYLSLIITTYMNASLRNGLYILSLTPGVVVVYGNLHGGLWAAGNVFYSLVVLGIIDLFSKNFLSSAHSGKDDTIPNMILWAHVPLQLLCMVSFVYGVRNEIISGYHIWLAALSMGIYSGSGAIVVAHEFIHRKAQLWQLAGKFLLFTAGIIFLSSILECIINGWAPSWIRQQPKEANRCTSFFSPVVWVKLKVHGNWKRNAAEKKDMRLWVCIIIWCNNLCFMWYLMFFSIC
jgi:hypothetical protein